MQSLNDPTVTIEQARVLLGRQARPLPSVDVDVGDALGLRLAEAVYAAFDLPPDDVSMMDGYAGRSEELSSQALPISVEVRAGMPCVELSPGTVARIQTGAVIPAGADTVVAQEQAVVRPDGRVSLSTGGPGQFIRKKGEIRAAGQALADVGQLITPQLMGLLAAAGPAGVRAIPRPRLAILTTGSELIGPHELPTQGKIHDSNASMLRSLAMVANLPAIMHERITDSRQELRSVLALAAAGADLVVTSGGVSVGDYDLVRGVIEELRGEILFHRIAIRPGKPTLVARLGSAWVVGLPGNPLSALVGWHLLVRPLADRLAGHPAAFEQELEAGILSEAASNPGDRTTFAPARATSDTGESRIQLIPWKGSHDLYAVSQANALAVLPPGFKTGEGGKVPFLQL